MSATVSVDRLLQVHDWVGLTALLEHSSPQQLLDINRCMYGNEHIDQVSVCVCSPLFGSSGRAPRNRHSPCYG